MCYGPSGEKDKNQMNKGISKETIDKTINDLAGEIWE